jgi:WD40 repeat protein
MFTQPFQICLLLSSLILMSLSPYVPFTLANPTDESTNELTFIYGGLTWSPDGNTLAIGTNDGVWLHTVADLTSTTQLVEQSFVASLDWSPDGHQIASGGENGNILILESTTGQITYNLQGHTGKVTSVVWSPNGSFLASASWDNTIRIWDASEGVTLHTIELNSRYLNYSLTWSHNSEQIATYFSTGQEGYIGIWDIETGEANIAWTHNRETCCVKWSPDGRVIATGGGDNQIRIWDPTTGELLNALDPETIHTVDALAWSPDSLYLASNNSSDHEATIYIWNTTTWELIAEFQGGIMTGDAFYTNALAWSPDSTRLASVSDDGRIFLWDMETYEQIAVYEGYRSILLSDQ